MDRLGIITDLSNEHYHADDALGHSGMVELYQRSALHFRTWAQTANETNEAMEFGAAFHIAMLEPDTFNDRVAVQPPTIKVRRGKKWEKFLSENAGKAIIKKEHEKYGLNIIRGMMESLQRPEHSTARALLQMQGINEQSIFWKCPVTGIRLKARPDKRVPRLLSLIELKTTIDASETAFPRIAARLGYDIQAGLYLNGINAAQDQYYRDFIFICFEVKKPHAIAVYRAPYEMIETGRQKVKVAVERFKEAQDLNRWAGYPDQVQDFTWPRWATL